MNPELSSFLTVGDNERITIGVGEFLTLGDEEIQNHGISFDLNFHLEWTKDYIKLTVKLPFN